MRRVSTVTESKHSLVPSEIKPRVHDVLNDADYIIVGPGDLYSSIVSVSLVQGFKDVFRFKAKNNIIMNLMTKSAQTPNYTAQDHIDDLQNFARKPDCVIINLRKYLPKRPGFTRRRVTISR